MPYTNNNATVPFLTSIFLIDLKPVYIVQKRLRFSVYFNVVYILH